MDYWTSLAREYHAETAERFRIGGLDEVQRYVKEPAYRQSRLGEERSSAS